MEVIIFILIVGAIIFFSNVAKFNEKISAIGIDGYKIFSEQDLAVYRDYLMCQTVKKYPEISDSEKVKLIIEAIRSAHIGKNKDYLNGASTTYKYVFLSYLDRLQEIKVMDNYKDGPGSLCEILEKDLNLF
jgi:hypothetical protein